MTSTSDKLAALMALGHETKRTAPTSAGFNWWGRELTNRRWKKKCHKRQTAARSRTVNQLKAKGKRYGPTT